MINLKLKKITYSTLILFFLIFGESLADVGVKAIDIECNKKNNYFRFEPYIMWNEDLDQFHKSFPKHKRSEKNKETYLVTYFGKDIYRNDIYRMSFKCQLKDNLILAKISDINNRNLNVSIDGNTVFEKKIDNVWDVSGLKYFVETKGDSKMQECCSADCKSAVNYNNTNCSTK